MSVVAPVSALVSTVLPVAVALSEGERPGALVYAGAGLCLAAIVLVSAAGPADAASPADPKPGAGGWRGRWRAAGYGTAAGIAFGIFFVFMRYGAQSGALWPVAAARLAGLAAVTVATAAIRVAPVPRQAGRQTLAAAVGAGVLDSLANVCYVLATRAGLFGLAVVLVSLYPGITVLLARVLLGERLRRAQRAGLLIAALGVTLAAI